MTSDTPSSPSIGEPIESVKSALSSSNMSAEELSEVLTAPTLGEEIVAMTDSVFSIKLSSMTGIVIVVELAPSGIENVVMSV